MYNKIDRYILIAVLVVVIAILYFVYKNKQETGDQSNLLLAMADKLGASSEPEAKADTYKITEDDNTTVTIAEKLYFKKGLTQIESEYYHVYKDQVEAEFEFSKSYHPLVNKFVIGATEFTDDEKAFYDANKDIIDAEVERRKEMNANKAIIVPLHPADETDPAIIKGANPPMARGERLKVILSFFEDGVPKSVTQLSELYAAHTGSPVNKGNMSSMFGKLEGKELLHQDIQKDGRWRVYYGLPEWFDGKKLKKEYKLKIK